MKFKIFSVVILTLSVVTYANDLFGLESWINSFRTPNFEKIEDIDTRKKIFFNYLKPTVEKENNKILLLRNLIKNNNLNSWQTKKLTKKYRLSSSASKQELLDAIDIIPTSLVLAQAAIESNWGRSRFAKYNYNFFGIWCFEKGCGVVPRKRDKDAKHEVAKFSSISKSVEYYMLNINRNFAYETLRKIRKNKRDNNLIITGLSLAEGLENYAQIGYDYVEKVQEIIRYNELEKHSNLSS